MGSNATTTPGVRFGSYDSSSAISSYCGVYGGAYTNALDERLKRDIEPLPYGLDEIMRLKPCRYTLKQSGERTIGLIAQEVLPIIPEPVNVPDNPDELTEDGNLMNPYGIDLSSLIALALRGIQQQQEQIQELKAEIDELYLVIYTMGCGPCKELKTNVSPKDPDQVVGSTLLRADQIVVLNTSVFLPTKTLDGKSAILEVSINDKKYPSIKDIEINWFVKV
ncbi:unnamed protein product [Phytophthora lilii]|uniref:Unnamed protein product n=1 Tax=Phytophthora lilii TaxID=2077276 RepID=A0A9W6UEG1_9STRA|nr:unnamed protein product [Phytophthora lilii]